MLEITILPSSLSSGVSTPLNTHSAAILRRTADSQSLPLSRCASPHTQRLPPPLPVPFLQEEREILRLPTDRPTFIDAAGDSLSRGGLKALTLGLGLEPFSTSSSFPLPGRAKPRDLSGDDVVTIFSSNSLSWPLVLFGDVAAGFKIALATSTSPGFSHQSTDRRARMLVVAPSQLSIKVKLSTTILKVPESGARARI
ncbi:hypothetical protein EST38_g6550 [Candolleomyces aberdarensis]|uniref:AMP-dependent synthetase/ligase domain-containing protein n=1 Tax=Candolleomyces aberdarensis TaxID=2316362 RepID=A0A4Q2DJK7_9AGAR|nr:hypothetical protein EST38_g6550 [Candolleomyces aberdarensis]